MRAARASVVAAVLAVACGGSGIPPSDPGGGGVADLSVDGKRAGLSARVLWQFFGEGDCAIAEGCVGAPGWRRLLRFETFTPNIGTADVVLGRPEDHPDRFHYSACHRHYHYDGYADYRLLDAGGREVALGHKQAFCVEDSEQIGHAPWARNSARYTCEEQGLSRGWGDVYGAELDCQWVDVTDTPAGSYGLQITINGEHTIPESSYEDNVSKALVAVPEDVAVDPTARCPNALEGPRDCGWSPAASGACTPGQSMRVGCADACGLGTCSGDPILRVCPGDGPCTSRFALAFNDDGCSRTFCPLTEFDCPAEGRFTVMTAPYRAGDAYTCAPAAAPVP